MNDLLKNYTDSKNNIFQSDLWRAYQEKLGRKTFLVDCNECKVLVIKMPLWRNHSYLYCPRAPQLSVECWQLFTNKVKEIAKTEKSVFVRVEPFIVPNGTLGKLCYKKIKWFSPLSQQYSPNNTLLLDLMPEEEDILAQMKSKWRYNIRLAEKKGVKVRESNAPEDLKMFHELSRGMLDRGYSAFGYDHYKALVDALGKNLTMFVAEYKKEILSTILVTYYGEVAIYLHGASSDSYRELMPNHLVQWKAITEAKKRGCKVYDFWGIAPEGAQNHKWAGITRFKLGFGGEQVHFLGAFDYTFSPFWYIMLCSVNFVRKALFR